MNKSASGSRGRSIDKHLPNESNPTVQPLFDMLGFMAGSLEPNVDSSDFYARLGVSREASEKGIKTAFRALARSHHPDRAGRDPESAERFKKIREAYETLSDSEKRRRYDSRGKSRPGMNAFRWSSDQKSDNQDHRSSYSDDLDLNDIFSDRLKGGIFRGAKSSSDSTPDFGFGEREVPRPTPGSDIVLVVTLPRALAELGGSHTLEYGRMVRAEDGQGLRRQQEIFDLRLGPGNVHGDSIRIPKLGNVGTHGGANGDLICDLLVHDEPVQADNAPPRTDASAKRNVPEVEHVVFLTIQKALLGGRVEVECPGGRVSLRVPPCSSSGQRLRIAGKGVLGTNGLRGDHEVRLEISSPSSLDEKSRILVEEFGALNPYDPKEGHES